MFDFVEGICFFSSSYILCFLYVYTPYVDGCFSISCIRCLEDTLLTRKNLKKCRLRVEKMHSSHVSCHRGDILSKWPALWLSYGFFFHSFAWKRMPQNPFPFFSIFFWKKEEQEGSAFYGKRCFLNSYLVFKWDTVMAPQAQQKP